MKNVFNFSSGYRPFCSYWWKHYLRPGTYYWPFVYAYQRVVRGWADCDTWSLDGRVAQMLAEAVEHLRVHSQGYPSGLSEEIWNGMLKEMVEGFEAYLRSNDVPDQFVQKLETSTGIWADLGLKDSVCDWDKIKAYQEAELAKFHNGMKLFVEHYQSLWD